MPREEAPLHPSKKELLQDIKQSVTRLDLYFERSFCWPHRMSEGLGDKVASGDPSELQFFQLKCLIVEEDGL